MEETKYALVHKRSAKTEEIINTVVGDGFTTVYTPSISVRFEHVDGALVNDDYEVTGVAPVEEAKDVEEEVAPDAPEAPVQDEETVPEVTPEEVAPVETVPTETEPEVTQ